MLSVLKSELTSTDGLEFIHIPTDEDLKQLIHKLDILTTYHLKNTTVTFATDRLKWIHFGSAGIDHSLFPELFKSKPRIPNASGVHAGPVLEFVISIILYFAKRFKDCSTFKRSRTWTQREVARQMVQLKGRTLGIIGFGSLGKAIAKKAKAFDIKVIATRWQQEKVEKNKTTDELIPLDYLLSNSDFIAIACPLTPLTKGMIGKRELSKMKKRQI